MTTPTTTAARNDAAVRLRTEDELRSIGSLKWTGMDASDGAPVLGAWVAEMDYGTSPEVETALTGAIRDGLLGYPPRWLEPRVQESTAAFQAHRFGWEIQPGDVRLVSSVLPALRATISHFVRLGAPVIVPTPAYMPFLTVPEVFGHPVIQVPSLRGRAAEGRGWALDLEGIRAGLERGAGLVILCNPWNPTGRVLTPAELGALGDAIADFDALVFSDEIHSPLALPGHPHTSFASLGPALAAHTVTATAAAKGWNIAGLPSAQVILPDPELRARWDAFAPEVVQGVTTLGTIATLAACDSDVEGASWQTDVRRLISDNVDLLAALFRGSPLEFTPPEGGYLAWVGYDHVALGDPPARELLDRAHIGANDGAALGTGWERWVRLNLACSPDTARRIAEGALSILPAAAVGTCA